MIPRRLVLVLGLAVLAACAKKDLTDPPAALGNFQLGFAVVIADNMKKVPISRDATVEEWEAALQKALDARFGRYQDGTKLYNIGVAVDGYALAPPGIPLVASPKSILVTSATVFDDAAQTMLNPEGKGKQITAFERGGDGSGIVGTGYTRTKQEQIDELAFVTALRVEEWLADNPEWFGLPPKRAGIAAPTR
ncbi:MAG: hypothetical protein ACT4OK_18465 [Gemmobacter sp.]